MSFFRSLIFALVFYAGTLVAILAALPALHKGELAVRAGAVRWARFHRWCCRNILGIESRIEGQVPEGSFLAAAKHQSMYETLELILILDQPAVVLKQELADIPLWGALARKYGTIPIIREGSAPALRSMLKAARTAIANGRAILIFPEGTRVAPGEQPALKAGFAGIYKTFQLPVVPIALDSGRVWPRNSFLKRPGIVTFRFGETLSPGLDRADIETRVHAAINALDSP